MKKYFALFAAVLLLLTLPACVQPQNDPTRTADEPTDVSAQPPGFGIFYGMIVGNLSEKTLLVTENKTEGKTQGLFTLSAEYLTPSQDSSLLVPGTYFALQYGGYIMDSYPAQFGKPSSFTCEGAKEDLVTPLVGFLLEKIPADAEWIALDLTGVEGLSDGEEEAVLYLLSCKKTDSIGVARYDPSFHTAEELLADENSPDGGAVLAVEARLQDGKLNGTWKLTDTEEVIQGNMGLPLPYYVN